MIQVLYICIKYCLSNFFFNLRPKTSCQQTFLSTHSFISRNSNPLKFPNALSVCFLQSYKLVEPPDGLFGAPTKNGSWNGMVGMLTRGVSFEDAEGCCWGGGSRSNFISLCLLKIHIAHQEHKLVYKMYDQFNRSGLKKRLHGST